MTFPSTRSRCRHCGAPVERREDHVLGCDPTACDGTYEHVRTSRHNAKPCSHIGLVLTHQDVVVFGVA